MTTTPEQYAKLQALGNLSQGVDLGDAAQILQQFSDPSQSRLSNPNSFLTSSTGPNGSIESFTPSFNTQNFLAAYNNLKGQYEGKLNPIQSALTDLNAKAADAKKLADYNMQQVRAFGPSGVPAQTRMAAELYTNAYNEYVKQIGQQQKALDDLNRQYQIGSSVLNVDGTAAKPALTSGGSLLTPMEPYVNDLHEQNNAAPVKDPILAGIINTPTGPHMTKEAGQAALAEDNKQLAQDAALEAIVNKTSGSPLGGGISKGLTPKVRG